MGGAINNPSRPIDGVVHTPLRRIVDERGMVMHHLNHLSPTFKGFEESYISKTYPGKLKAWKLHRKMTQNFCVPVGRMHFVLFDARDDSPTKGEINEFVLDDADQYALLCIPPGIWYGFECLGIETALIVNVSNVYYDPTEALKLDPFDASIPYSGWTNEKP
ncbi:MAG TPA: dTDP-4-dehydrorhamnose 3,5-epimerase family protein [Dinghuibacter sp.]|jgi:dTDP-4-dehydrorhamnose 3,5-epimerase|uniref:dTDP-4-dehydrorhamnose 3,5-epimerase family protein n=1 Tax=Dinghuibacter sp. TaxID=2024697 RepID=UPI002C4AD596|nr:dTDP-4-dehydrorhamnose 3,5-epimerase family protein [Dinghuibacter sp.]HTJ10970.1 dTDP-4-dehydrorhamnose 3,5-epimerase family protein [Dinghuibacter sp.]